MDNIEEVIKLKQLLDEGIIDEEDFRRKKAELLGIKKEYSTNPNNSKNNESKSSNNRLEDYEKELIAQNELKEKYNNESSDSNYNYYERLKLKAKVNLETEQEYRRQKREEQKEVLLKYTDTLKFIVNWILAIVLWVSGTIFILASFSLHFVYFATGLIMLLQGSMLCPKTSERTVNFPTYTKYKPLIFFITIFIWISLVILFPVNNV